MTPKRPRKVKLAFVAVPLALLVVALIATVSIAKASPPSPSKPLPSLNRFYVPKHSTGGVSAQGGVQPLSTSNNLRHGSGPVMHTSTTYAIFWEPAHLQSGASTSVGSTYNSLQTRFLTDVGNTSFYNIMTQYYDANTTAGHIQNTSTFGGSYIDTTAYPAHNSDCTTQGSSNPTNCIGDSQMQGEITKVKNARGWAGGTNVLFILFTMPGEDTCSNIVGGCSSNAYCGFHFYYGSGNQPYAILPYNGSGQGCDAGQPTPNNADADHEISTLSHELFEAVTDPWPNQNWTGPLGEIGDACAYKYGSYSLDGGKANESLHGHYYSTQMEWSNAIGNCAQTR